VRSGQKSEEITMLMEQTMMQEWWVKGTVTEVCVDHLIIDLPFDNKKKESDEDCPEMR